MRPEMADGNAGVAPCHFGSQGRPEPGKELSTKLYGHAHWRVKNVQQHARKPWHRRTQAPNKRKPAGAKKRWLAVEL